MGNINIVAPDFGKVQGAFISSRLYITRKFVLCDKVFVSKKKVELDLNMHCLECNVQCSQVITKASHSVCLLPGHVYPASTRA